MYQERFMRRAIELSARALGTAGTEPFGAVVVKDGEIVGEGLNRAVLNNDPTSHGETEAIRDACRNLGTVDLTGCDLYTSCEPCALCVAAMGISGIARLYYASGLDDANAALRDVPRSTRPAVDPHHLRTECARSVGERSMPSHQACADDALNVLRTWAGRMSGGPDL